MVYRCVYTMFVGEENYEIEWRYNGEQYRGIIQ